MPTVTALVNINAQDNTSGELNKVGGAFNSLGGVMKGALVVGAAAATAAIGGIVAGLTSSVAAAIEAQEVQAQLNAVLESTGGKAGVTADMANALASSYQAVTRFGDEAILSGENLLLTFTGIGKDVFPLATEAMLNMSQSMGQDLKTSAIQLGKALNDPLQGMTALTRVGVTFTDAQKAAIQSMVEMGDVAGAQKLILQELQVEFGGSAVAAGQTFAGQLDILKNKLGDVQERVGTALLPIVSRIFSHVAPLLVSAAEKVAIFFEALTGGDAEKARSILAGIFGARTVAMVDGFIRSIRNVAGIVDAFVNHLQGVSREGIRFTMFLDDLPASLQSIAVALGDMVNAFLDKDPAAMMGAVRGLMDAVIQFVADNAGAWAIEIGEKIGSILNSALTLAVEAGRGVIEIVKVAAGWIGGIIDTLNDPAKRAIWSAEISDAIEGIIALADAWVRMSFPGFYDFIHNAIATLADPAKRAILVAELGDAIVGLVTLAVAYWKKNIAPLVTEATAVLIKFLNDALDGLLDTLEKGEVGATIGKLAGQFIELIVSAVEALAIGGQGGKDNSGRITTALVAMLDQAIDGIAQAGKGKNWIGRIIRAMALSTTLGNATPEELGWSNLGAIFVDKIFRALIPDPFENLIPPEVIDRLKKGMGTMVDLALVAFGQDKASIANLQKSLFQVWLSIFSIQPDDTLFLGLQIMTGILDGIAQAMQKTPLTFLGGKALENLVVNPMKEALEQARKEAESEATDIGKGVATGIETGLKEGETTLRQRAEALGMVLPDGIEKGVKTEPGHWVPLIVQPVETAVNEGTVTLRSIAEKYGMALPQGVTTALKQNMTVAILGPLVDQPLRATLDATNKWVLPASQGLGESTATGVTTGITSNFSEGILAALIERPLSAMLGTTVTVITPQADKVGTTIAEKTGKGISGNQSKITDAMQAAMDATATIGAESGNVANPNSIIAKLLGAWDTINSLALTAWETIRDTILTPVAELPAKILAWFTGTPEGGESVLTKLQSIDLSAAGAGIIGTLSAGLESAWTGVTAWFEARKNDIQNFLNTLNALISGAPTVPSTPSGPPQSQQDMIDELINQSNPPPAAPPGGGRPHQAQSLIADTMGSITGAKNLTASIGDVIAMMREAAQQILGMIRELIPADEKLLKITSDQVNVFRNVADAARGFVDLYAKLGELKNTSLPSLSALSDLVRALTNEFLALAASFGDEKAMEKAGNFADTAARFPAPIIAVIDLIAAIEEMPAIPPDLQARIASAVEVVRVVVAQIGSLADMAWEDMAEFADHAGRAIDLLISATAFRDAIAEWADDLKDKIAPRVEVLVAVVAIVVSAFNKFAEESKAMVHPLSEAAVAFLDSVGPVFDLLEAAHSLRNGIAEWAEELVGKIAPRIAVLVAVAGLVAAEFNRFADEASGWAVPLSEAAQAFLDSLGEVFGILQSAGDLRNSLETWVEDLQEKIAPRIAVLVSVLGLVAAALNAAAAAATGWVQPLSEAAAAFVSSFGEAIGLLQAAHGLRQVLEDWTDEVVGLVAPRVDVLVSILGLIAAALNTAADAAAGWAKPLSEAAQAFVTSLGPAISALQAAYGLRQVLDEWTNEVKDKIAIRIDVLVSVLGMAAAALNKAADEATGWVAPLSEAAQAFIASLGPALSILQTTVAFRQTLADWTNEVKGKIALRIETLVSVLGLVAIALNEAADEAKGWAKPLSGAAAAFVASLAPAMTLLQSTFTFRQALADWSDEVKGKVAIRVETLVAVLGIIAQKLNEAADKATGWVKPLSETATAFIASVGAAVGVLQSAQAFREALGDWSDEMKGKVADRVAVLVSVLGIIATELNTKAAEGALPEITDAVKAFAERVGPLTSALQGAIGLLRDLADLEIPADVEGKTRDLLANLLAVITVTDELLKNIDVELDKAGNEIPEAMRVKFERWAARMAPLASIISGTVGMVRDLVDIPDVAEEGLQNKVAMLVFDMHLIRQAVDMLLDELGKGIPDDQFIDAMKVKFERWSERIGPLTNIISSTMGLVRDLVDIPDIAEEGLDTKVRMLIFDMHLIRQAVDAMLDELGQVTDTAFTDAMRIKFERWAARIAPLANIISSAVGLVASMVDVKPGVDLQAKTTQLLADLNTIFITIRDGLEAIGDAADTDFIDEVRVKLERWAARISPLTTIISGAVSAVQGLVEVKAVADVEGAARRLIDLIEQIVITFDEVLDAIAVSDDGLDAVAEKLKLWAARVSAVATIISGGISALESISAFKGASLKNLDAFIADILELTRRLDAALSGQISEELEKTAERLGKVFAPIVSITQGIAALLGHRRLLPAWIDRWIADIVEIIGKLSTVTVPEDVAQKVADLAAVLGPIRDIVLSMISLRGYTGLLPAWIQRFIDDIKAVLLGLANIPAFNAGFTVGVGFGHGFTAGFQSVLASFTWPLPPGGNPVRPPGIPPETTGFYNYGSITVTASGPTLAALLEDLQAAVRQG